MGHVTYPDGIAIWKVVYYTPALFASVYICCRHGFLKSSGWFFLVTFCLTRLIGSCAQLATISHADHTAETIALVCTLMGTSPLLLSSLGLLSRIYNSILSQFWSILFQLGVLKIVQTPAIIGFILCIVGATSASNPTAIEHESTVRAGIILYLVVFLILCILALIAVCCRHKVPDGERVFIKAIMAALPFILVHIVYSLCAAFSHDSTFDPATGSTTVSLFMSVLEEMAVVIIYIYAGLKTRCTPLPEDASASRQLGYRFGRGDFGTGKLGLLSLGFGVVSTLGDRRVEKAEAQEQHHRKHRSSHRQHHRKGSSQHHQRHHSDHRRDKRLPGKPVKRADPGYFSADV